MFLHPDLARQLAAEHRRQLTPSSAETACRQLRWRAGRQAERDAVTVRTIFRRIAPAISTRRERREVTP